MNVITLDGRLVDSPSELREVEGKNGPFKVRTFRIAHTLTKDETLFLNVEAFGGWAENFSATKGDPVVVVGELKESSFVGKDGKKRSTFFVRAREVKLLSRFVKEEPTA